MMTSTHLTTETEFIQSVVEEGVMSKELQEAIDWLTKVVALGFPITSPKHLPLILETLQRNSDENR